MVEKIYDHDSKSIRSLTFDKNYRRKLEFIIHDLSGYYSYPCNCDFIHMNDLEYFIKKNEDPDWELRCTLHCWPMELLNSIASNHYILAEDIRNFYNRFSSYNCYQRNSMYPDCIARNIDIFSSCELCARKIIVKYDWENYIHFNDNRSSNQNKSGKER